MAVQVYEVGREGCRVAVIDGFLSNPDQVVQLASDMAPFPDIEDNYYPGLRRLIRPEEAAFAYVDATCGAIAPILKQLWGVERFRITEASFSMVTRRPEETQLIQRVPHYDSFDPHQFAVLHYLSRAPMGGTAFYCHSRSGFEMMTQARDEAYRAALNKDLEVLGPPEAGYFNETTQAWEKIGEIGWQFNRLLIYQGALFHSGIIPDDFGFSPDPLRGRLTGNIFLQATQTGAPLA